MLARRTPAVPCCLLLLVALVAVGFAADANDEYRVADFVGDYVAAAEGQTRDAVRKDGWLYGKTTSADMFAFEPLAYTKGHSCFGSAYGDGLCLFVQGSNDGHLHPDPSDKETAARYTFQQAFESVRVNGTLRRVRPSGDGNTVSPMRSVTRWMRASLTAALPKWMNNSLRASVSVMPLANAVES